MQHLFRRRLTACLALALAGAGSLALPAAHASDALSTQSRLTESRFKSIVLVSQYYGQDGVLTMNQKSGPMTKSEGGYGLERNTQSTKNISYSGMPRALSAGTGPAATMTQAQAMSTAATWASQYAQVSAKLMAEELERLGVSGGMLTYSEEVKILRENDSPVSKVLSFIMSVDRNGRAVYGAPVLTTPDPDVVYAMYTPLRAGDGFDTEGWSMPNAGTLAYQILDSKGNAKTNLTYLNTGGAYDGAPGSADSGISCLMDKTNSGCAVAANVPDIKALMLKHAADLAIVDFTSQVTPVYDEAVDENGETVYQPRGALSYTDRLWSCTAYNNTGSYGYVLDVNAARYFARLDADQKLNYTFTQKYTGTALSPVKEFNKTVIGAAVPGNPAYYVISPIVGDDRLIHINSPELKGVTYIAPTRTLDNMDAIKNASVTGFPLTIVSESGDSLDFNWGAFEHYSHGHGTYDGAISFNLKSPESFTQFALMGEYVDDITILKVNGIPVYSAPWGGAVDINRVPPSTHELYCAGNSCGSMELNISGYLTGGSYPSVSHINQGLNNPYAPAGFQISSPSEYACGAQVYYGDENGGGYVFPCVVQNIRTYKSCTKPYDSEGSYSYGYQCSNVRCDMYEGRDAAGWGGQITVSPGYGVAYTMPDGRNNCTDRDSGWSAANQYINLMPYLRTGQNVITGRLISQTKGYFFMNFRVRGCAADYNLPTGSAPPVPPGGTPGGILDKLEQMHGKPFVPQP